VERLLAVSQMSESWRGWAADYLRKAHARPAEPSEPGFC
jgi:hypothetical protein